MDTGKHHDFEIVLRRKFQNPVLTFIERNYKILEKITEDWRNARINSKKIDSFIGCIYSGRLIYENEFSHSDDGWPANLLPHIHLPDPLPVFVAARVDVVANFVHYITLVTACQPNERDQWINWFLAHYPNSEQATVLGMIFFYLTGNDLSKIDISDELELKKSTLFQTFIPLPAVKLAKN